MHPPPCQARQAAPRPSPDRLLWAVRVRWLVIGGFLLLALVAHALGLFASVRPCLAAAAVGSVLNALNEWCVRRGRYVGAVTAVAIPLDQLIITYVVLNTGGVQSPFLMLYVVEVLATAMLVGTWAAAGSTVLAIVLWTAAVSGAAAPPLRAVPAVAGSAPAAVLYHGTWAAFLLYCLSLLVFLGGYISRRLRVSERDLARQNARLHAALAAQREAHAALQAAYARLQRTEAHLVQSEKMRGLGQLVAGVAHELNNPISFVSGNVEHLRRGVERLCQLLQVYAGLPLPAEMRRQIDAIRESQRVGEALADLPGLLDDCEEGARRTTQIVNQLRAFSRSDDEGAWRPADLHRGIDTTLGLLAHRLKDHVTVHRRFGDMPDVECSPGQINQVFMNLLTNAADSIGAHAGNIWITTGLRPAGVPDGSPMATIVIRDDGPGMTPETRARVFDPFFTTKPVGHGTGLGLSVSYGIVQRHGGSLTVESAPGHGASFTVALPLRRPPPSPPPPA
jgi:signal transduction histidine kinase